MLNLTLGATLLVASAASTLSSDDPYTVFLDGRDTAPGVNTLSWDITAGPAGEIYAVGIRSPNGWLDDEDTENIVLRRLDRGTTWETATATPYDGKSFTSAKVDRDGSLYAMRDYYNAAELWRSTAADQGANMRHLTTFSEEFPGFLVTWKGMAVDAAGRVYVHGERSGFDGSVLRASANGNSGTWGDYDLAPGASFYGMAVDDEGSLYLAGDCYDAELDGWPGCIRKLPAP